MTLSRELETLARTREAHGASKKELTILGRALEVAQRAEHSSLRKQLLGVLSQEPSSVVEIRQRLTRRRSPAAKAPLSSWLNDHVKAGRATRTGITCEGRKRPLWTYALTPVGEDFLEENHG